MGLRGRSVNASSRSKEQVVVDPTPRPTLGTKKKSKKKSTKKKEEMSPGSSSTIATVSSRSTSVPPVASKAARKKKVADIMPLSQSVHPERTIFSITPKGTKARRRKSGGDLREDHGTADLLHRVDSWIAAAPPSKPRRSKTPSSRGRGETPASPKTATTKKKSKKVANAVVPHSAPTLSKKKVRLSVTGASQLPLTNASDHVVATKKKTKTSKVLSASSSSLVDDDGPVDYVTDLKSPEPKSPKKTKKKVKKKKDKDGMVIDKASPKVVSPKEKVAKKKKTSATSKTLIENLPFEDENDSPLVVDDMRSKSSSQSDELHGSGVFDPDSEASAEEMEGEKPSTSKRRDHSDSQDLLWMDQQEVSMAREKCLAVWEAELLEREEKLQTKEAWEAKLREVDIYFSDLRAYRSALRSPYNSVDSRQQALEAMERIMAQERQQLQSEREELKMGQTRLQLQTEKQRKEVDQYKDKIQHLTMELEQAQEGGLSVKQKEQEPSDSSAHKRHLLLELADKDSIIAQKEKEISELLARIAEIHNGTAHHEMERKVQSLTEERSRLLKELETEREMWIGRAERKDDTIEELMRELEQTKRKLEKANGSLDKGSSHSLHSRHGTSTFFPSSLAGSSHHGSTSSPSSSSPVPSEPAGFLRRFSPGNLRLSVIAARNQMQMAPDLNEE